MLLVTYRVQGVFGAMHYSRLFMCLVILVTSSQVIANKHNPFKKEIVVTAGHDIAWQFGEHTATRSVQGVDGTWYHLFYDGLRLRLRLTGSAEDSQYAARQFEDFAVYDVKIDGKRLNAFQWCLSNQDGHHRFLQQGLSVKKAICQNKGEQGAFVMRLTKDILAALNSGHVIEYELKPVRAKVRVKFSIDDFNTVISELSRQNAARRAAGSPEPVPLAVAPAAVAAAPASAPAPEKKPETRPKCKLDPPKGFPEINSIEYECDNLVNMINAQAAIDLKVEQIYQRRNKSAVETQEERKRLESARNRKQAEAARRAKEALKKEQEALAASAEVQEELSTDIAKKMISVCGKKWAAGEHRCYCEKYIEFAPAKIKANPECK